MLEIGEHGVEAILEAELIFYMLYNKQRMKDHQNEEEVPDWQILGN
jgi:hypothetical protein